MSLFNNTVDSLCLQLARRWCEDISAPAQSELLAFVLAQLSLLPGYYRWPIRLLTLCYGLSGFFLGIRLSHRLSDAQQQRLLRFWLRLDFPPTRLLLRFYRSLVLLQIFSDPRLPAPRPVESVEQVAGEPPSEAEVVVIGSGPGGAITATLLAEAGFEVVLLEEGAATAPSAPYSASEFNRSLRYGGLGVMMGRPPIAYLEGRCVGGASQINSGLYLRPMTEVLDRWRQQYGVEACSLDELLPHFEANERDLGVSSFEGDHPPAGRKLAEGARAMGWRCIEVKKWRRYQPGAPWRDGSRRPYRGMAESFLPRYLAAGGRLLDRHKVHQIRPLAGGGWQVEAEGGKRRCRIKARHLFVAAGAVQTPALLRRSHITHNIGNSLQSSLIVKVIARFPDPVNSDSLGMPVQQVREFAPDLTLGCGISNPAQLALGLQGYPQLDFALADNWHHCAIYSVILASSARGKVRNLPGGPWVTYSPTEQDWLALGRGLKQLSRLLLAAGASELYPVMSLPQPLRTTEEVDRLNDNLRCYQPQLTALHLSASCPMGAIPTQCATDSFGKVYHQQDLYINDASLLCSYPGANPQALVMALARRNAEQFIKDHTKP